MECQDDKILILGCGAVGAPLAALLTEAGRKVVVVRTSDPDLSPRPLLLKVRLPGRSLGVEVESVGLSRLDDANGLIVVATKAHFNQRLAGVLRAIPTDGPLVILQNGLGVERPFLGHFPEVFRAVLYVTGEGTLAAGFEFGAVSPSPLGLWSGTSTKLPKCIATLSTDSFPFVAEPEIETEVWKKVIVNCVFNTVCPLLETDNGVFAREAAARHLARELVDEGVALAGAMGIVIHGDELMEKIQLISRGSDKLISTLQDIRHGRETEIRFLNLELARLALDLRPSTSVPKLELLGRIVELKAEVSRRPEFIS